MTEQMAIECLEYLLNECVYMEHYVQGREFSEASNVIRKALEEIQQIKETIKDFALDCGGTVSDVKEMYRQLNKYLKIGTAEELQALKEKSVAKKVTEKNDTEYHVDFICPNCNEAVYGQPYKPNYCKHCGQHLDWE